MASPDCQPKQPCKGEIANFFQKNKKTLPKLSTGNSPATYEHVIDSPPRWIHCQRAWVLWSPLSSRQGCSMTMWTALAILVLALTLSSPRMSLRSSWRRGCKLTAFPTCALQPCFATIYTGDNLNQFYGLWKELLYMSWNVDLIINSEPLPDIWEADWEFTRLAQYLGMADHDMSGYF